MITPKNRAKEITHLIEKAITLQPRSLQKTIGPSEIGNPCDHCLAARLAGWEKHEILTPWMPVIGTSVHAWLEKQFKKYEKQNPNHWLVEARICVGEIDGKPIWGSTDLVDVEGRMSVDWKICGDASLLRYKTGPSQTYRVQAHLYAKGWNDKGIPVDTVAIYFLPRNKQLRHGYWWHEPYQPKIALDALKRANDLQATLKEIEEAAGQDVRDAWISTLERAEKCWDCRRYPDTPKITTLNDLL